MLIGPVINFIERAQALLKSTQAPPGSDTATATSQLGATTPKVNYTLRQTPWASPQQISGVIQESQRMIKSKLATLQRSLQLYLSNKDTEFILFRPIRNNIISAFVKLGQILTNNGYSSDDLVITSCPSADQISVLLSNASIAADNIQQQQMHQMVTRKISAASSVDGAEHQRRISVERKISLDHPTQSTAGAAPPTAVVTDVTIEETIENIV